MKLHCKFGTKNVKIIEVNEDDYIFVLIEKLNLKDRKSKFIFNAETFGVALALTFKEIGLTSDSHINIINQAIAGNYLKNLL